MEYISNKKKNVKYVLFSTTELYTNNPTGGIRRFRELSEYLHENSNVLVCSMDSSDVMKNHGIINHVQIFEGKKIGLYKFLPPIFRIFFTNRSEIRKLKLIKYDKLIAFDIPPSLGLVLCGFRHVTMLIRKDLIGYEKVSSKSNLLVKKTKIAVQWIWELICVIKVNRIICQCDYDKNILKGRHPLFSKLIENKTKIQINNVNPSWIISKSKDREETNFNIQHYNFRVCFIGGFSDARKGQDFFLETAVEVLKDCDDVEFVLIGGGVHLIEYQNKYEHARILFLGRMNNPLSVLKACDLLIVPSLADSCPNTVMEALYNDILVLGSKRGGIPEILVDEMSLFDFDKYQLKDKILLLKRDTSTRASLKELQSVRKQVLSFNWAQTISQLL